MKPILRYNIPKENENNRQYIQNYLIIQPIKYGISSVYSLRSS